VFRAAECSVEEILAAYHGASLFHARELSIVLDVEDLARSASKVVALAEGIARPTETACLFLVESAAEAPPKTLEPLRESCRVRIEATPPSRAELLAWARRRFKNAGLEAEAGVAEAIAEACEGDALSFFNEIDKLTAYCGASGRVGRADASALLSPVVGAELEEYLTSVARGETGAAARRLGRILAAGEGEGGVLWALGNLVGGALGGWSRHPQISGLLRRRAGPRGLSCALDAVYRAESAWKEGRADAVAALEQATREVCAAE
jgi:DNA polymerase III delta subunit